MFESFYSGLVDELVKVAKKDKDRPSKGHSVGMLGGMLGAGVGAAHGYTKGLWGLGRTIPMIAKGTAGGVGGYLAARTAYSAMKRAKKHTKNVAEGDDQ
jgi:hypothetical protein